MKRILCALVALGLACASPSAWASCRSSGTQLDCTLGRGQVLIGTQTAAEPSRGRRVPALPLQGSDTLFDDRPATSWPLRLELQNVGTDPGLCWRFGEETYCH
jgi:hypothetical protein